MYTQIYLISLLWVSALSGIISLDPKDDGPLILTPLIEKHEIQKARQLSKVDPTLFAGVNSHAAYLTVNKTHNSNIFFWFFPVEGMPLNSTPWIVSLKNSFGESPLYGMLNEIGPIQCKTGTVERMPVTWATNYSLLFIDSPIGTGFSFTGDDDIDLSYASNEDMIAAALLNFIQQFLQVFPELRKAPLFIAGEEWAGKYIPAFGHYIHDDKSLSINLKGFIIGAGWINPPSLLHYSEWGLQLGVIDYNQAARIKKLEDKAIESWNKQDYENFSTYYTMSHVLLQYHAQADYGNFMLIPDSYNPDNCTEDFFNRRDVQNALHVKKMSYSTVRDEVSYFLKHDRFHPTKYPLEQLLEHYAFMGYTGHLDMINAYALSVHTYGSLNWTGAQAYRDADRVYVVDPDDDNLVNFYVKVGGNLMDVMVRNAGSSVPGDQPDAAKQAIDMFINQYK